MKIVNRSVEVTVKFTLNGEALREWCMEGKTDAEIARVFGGKLQSCYTKEFPLLKGGFDVESVKQTSYSSFKREE